MKHLSACRGLSIAFGTLLVTGNGQGINPVASFVITVHGGDGVTFRGSYLVTGASGESKENKVEGRVPAEFRALGTGVYLNFQNQSPGKEVEIRVDANGNRQL